MVSERRSTEKEYRASRVLLISKLVEVEVKNHCMSPGRTTGLSLVTLNERVTALVAMTSRLTTSVETTGRAKAKKKRWNAKTSMHHLISKEATY